MLDLFNVLDNVCKNVLGANGIPETLANIIKYVYTGIKVVIPILLIVFGMIELGKAITAQKEDEIKKAQSSFFKKLILAVMVFLVFTIVQFVVGFAGENSANSDADSDQTVWGCVNKLLNG